jgi:hypothetical protein
MCTSLIKDVMNLHLVEMELDGTMNLFRKKFLQKNQDIDCEALDAVSNDAVSSQLSLTEMAGTFVVHLVATALAIIVAIVIFCRKKPLQNDSGNATGTTSNNSNDSEIASKRTSNMTFNTSKRTSIMSNDPGTSPDHDQEQCASRPGPDGILSDVQSQLAELQDFARAQAVKQDAIAAKREELLERSLEDFSKKQDKVLENLFPKPPLKNTDPQLLRERVRERIMADLGGKFVKTQPGNAHV